MECAANRRQVVFTRRSEKQATRQPSEELHSDARFKALDLLADGSRRHAEFIGCSPETHMTGGRFEGTQAIQGRQSIAHCRATRLFRGQVTL
jgi:hypothetical protein